MGVAVLAVLAAAACGPDSTLLDRPADANASNPDPASPDLVEARRARAAMEAAHPPPEPASADALDAWLTERARRLAALPWAPDPSRVPADLRALDYDGYQAIGFRPEAALFGGEGTVAVHLAHPGFLYTEPVDLHVVAGGRIDTLRFDPALFHYDSARVGGGLPAPPPPEAGYAGFKIQAPDGTGALREVAVFQGASYFRLLGLEQVHGLSGRGLAVDVADPEGEEFPDFRAFWLVRPDAGERSLTILALLDSPSLTGAYRFRLTPGVGTTLDVDARLFAREDVGKLGVAPLTSMYLHGPRDAGRFDDFRPRVHDSQGLMAWTGRGEWIWRPLSNGPGLRVTQLRDHDPRGFGLVQRDRRFDDYLDAEALYHRRPSLWVETFDGPGEEGGWGPGGVELVEIPTPSEFNDNIVATWVPDRPFRAGEDRRYRYRLRTFDARLDAQRLLQVVRTSAGRDALPGAADAPPPSRRRFVVDFGSGTEGGGSAATHGSGDRPAAVLETSAGTVSDVVVQRLPDGAGWRVAFDLEPDGERPADLRLYLHAGGAPVSETWSYLWDPAAVGR